MASKYTVYSVQPMYTLQFHEDLSLSDVRKLVQDNNGVLDDKFSIPKGVKYIILGETSETDQIIP